MTDIFPPPFSVVVQEIDALENTETQHGHLMALMRHRAMLDAAPQPPVVEQPQVNSPEIPEGWKLVPVEPADSQIRAAQDTWWYACNCETYWDQIYAAMIAAAPQPPVVEQPQSVTNCHQSQPQGEQEPVAYYVMNGAALFQLFRSKSQADALAYDLQKRHDLSGSPAHFHVVPLYTHPQPKREPLTEADLYEIASNYFADEWAQRKAVMMLKDHGIGGKA